MMGKLPMWAQLANDYMGAGLDAESAGRWQTEIKNSVEGVSTNDVVAAIRANAGTDLKRKLTVADLIKWIKGSPVDKKAIPSCNLCHRGLIEYRGDLHEEQFTLDQYSVAPFSTIPCVCKSGAVRIQQMKIDNPEYLNNMRKKAVTQRLKYEKLCAELGTKMKNHRLVEFDAIGKVAF